MEVKYSILKKKRKDGRYSAYAYVPGQPRKYVYDEDPQELKRKLFDLVDEIQNGIVSSNITFEKYCEHWQKVYCENLSPTTKAEYERRTKKDLIPRFGKKKICEITHADIQEYMNEYGKNHSEKTSKNMLFLLSTIFSHAIKHSKIRKDNPCKGIVLNRTEPTDYNIYTVEEMQTFLNAVSGHELEIPIVLASLCGLRLSEVCGLKWKDIDFAKKKIFVRRAAVVVNAEVIIKVPKSKRSIRTIAMPEYVSRVLQQRRNMPEAFVFPGKDGGPANGNALSKRIARYRKKLGFPHTRFHDLRHFNATVMLESGVPDKQSAMHLGHSDVNMTKKYQHILQCVEDRPAKVIDSIFNSEKEKESSQVSKSVSNDIT